MFMEAASKALNDNVDYTCLYNLLPLIWCVIVLGYLCNTFCSTFNCGGRLNWESLKTKHGNTRQINIKDSIRQGGILSVTQ